MNDPTLASPADTTSWPQHVVAESLAQNLSKKIVVLSFAFSGALSLGYQVLWGKYLLDFIGVSAYSYAAVLAAFMGGLAIGSKIFGKIVDRAKSPLKMYAFLELGIGMYAVLYPFLRDAVAGFYAGWVSFTPDRAGAEFGMWAKVFSSALLLLPPTILMGGTYPALLRHAANQWNVGKKASQLYGVNAIGAVFGTLAMTFLLMPRLGMYSSLLFLALCNALVATAILVISRVSFRSPLPDSSSMRADHLEDVSPSKTRIYLLLIFLCGVLSFALEIAWTRYFGVVLGSSTYSFSIVLAAFISGIAAGSAFLAKRDDRILHPLTFFGWAQIAAALLILLSLPFYPLLPWIFEQFGKFLSTKESAFYLYEAGKLLLCYLIMLLPTFFIGMAIPLAVKGLNRSLIHLGNEAGTIYSVNTWGNVAGALLAGLFLLPALGMERLLRSVALLTFITGFLAVVLMRSKQDRRLIRSISVSCVLVGVLALYNMINPWQTAWFTLFPYRRIELTKSYQDAKLKLANREILLFKDDPSAHLMVKKEKGEVDNLSIYVNGKAEHSRSDIPTEILLAQIPMLFHSDPKNVLIIGLGAGVTTGSVLTHPVEHADVVDIVRGMPEAARFFRSANKDALNDPRLRMIGDDARNYVSYTTQKYDIIISQPSNPWTAGTGALFSHDFFTRALRVLRPHGFYTQWFQAYETGDESFLAVVRTFRSVFPFVYAFQGSARDLILIGSLSPVEVDWPQIRGRLSSSVQKDLGRLPLESFPALLYLQRFSPPVIDCLAALSETTITDDNHFLEYQAPIDMFQRLRPTLLELFDERLVSSPNLFWNKFVREDPSRIQAPETVKLLKVTGPSLILNQFQLANSSDPIPDRLTEIIHNADEKRALKEFDANSSSILLASFLNPATSEVWLQHTKSWLTGKLSPRLTSRIRRFQIDLLLASGQKEEATKELLKWSQEQSIPPVEWAAFSSSRISPQVLESVLSIYKNRVHSDFAERLLELKR